MNCEFCNHVKSNFDVVTWNWIID